MMEDSSNDGTTKKVLPCNSVASDESPDSWFPMADSLDGSEARETGGIEDIFRPLTNAETAGNKKSCDDGIHIQECPAEVDEHWKESRRNKHHHRRLKKTREAELHKISERKRRDKIREKMRTLQELIPNCNKPDKASVLDDAVKYLKSLKLQIKEAFAAMPQVRQLPRFQAYEYPFFSSFVPMRPGPGMEMVQMNHSAGAAGLSMPSLPPGYVHPSLSTGGGYFVPAEGHLAVPRGQVPFMTAQMLPPGRATSSLPLTVSAGFSIALNHPDQGDSTSPAAPTSTC